MNLTYSQPRKRRNVENNNCPLNIRFVAKTSDIRNFSRNIRSDVKTSEVATLTRTIHFDSRLENVALVDEISCVTKGFSGVKGLTKVWRVTFTHDCFSLKSYWRVKSLFQKAFMNKNLYQFFLAAPVPRVFSDVTGGLIQGKNLAERTHWSL